MRAFLNFIVFLCIAGLISCRNNQSSIPVELTEQYSTIIDTTGGAYSMCLGDDLTIHAISIEKKVYYRVDSTLNIQKKQLPEDINTPNYIQYNEKGVIISDIISRHLIYFDISFDPFDIIEIPRYPIKFRIQDNNILYMSDYLTKDSLYGYGVFEYDIVSLKEKQLFHGSLYDPKEMKESINLDIPGTIDFDIKNKNIYCIESRFDRFIVAKMKSKGNSRVLINNRDWIPIEYNESEKIKMKYQLEKVLNSSGYPIENVKFKHKLAIQSINIDTYSNIWIVSSLKDSNVIPIYIYSHSGKLKNRLLIEQFNEINLSFFNDYVLIYEINSESPKRASVYSYK